MLAIIHYDTKTYNQIGSFLLNTQIVLSEGVDHIWCSIVLILTFFFYNPKMKSVQKV